MPPQEVTSTTLEPPPPSEEPVAVPVPPRNESVVIETGEQESEPTTSEAVVAAARRERERKRTAPPPAIVLDNKSLSKYSEGQLTVASPAPGPKSEEITALDREAEREAYWRQRSLEARQRWREAYDAIPRLEGEAAELRTRFYATDDPYVRDGQVKPAWDRTLDELAQAKRDVKTAEAEVAAVMEEGRQAGALPGWLREGMELEPELRQPPKPANEPGEPVIMRDPPRDPNDPP
jgi:hypothetical protein